MKAHRLLAVLFLGAGPLWFALAGPADSPPAAADEGPPAKKQVSLAEIGPKPKPVPQPDPAAIDSALRRGVDFLVANQNKNGSWGTPELKGGVEIYAPIPG